MDKAYRFGIEQEECFLADASTRGTPRRRALARCDALGAVVDRLADATAPGERAAADQASAKRAPR